MVDDHLRQIEVKIHQAGLKLRKPLDERQVLAFEEEHRIALPEGYRRFLIEIGDGGPGPPKYGLVPLGREDKLPFRPEFMRGRQRHPFVSLPFPFTRPWIWEDDERTDEGEVEQVGHGSLYLGTHGCGIECRLIVTGPEKGTIWEFCVVGITPTEPERDFLGWYEDWLDGMIDL